MTTVKTPLKLLNSALIALCLVNHNTLTGKGAGVVPEVSRAQRDVFAPAVATLLRNSCLRELAIRNACEQSRAGTLLRS